MSNISKSKYINDKVQAALRGLAIAFIITTVVVPQYFGIPLPGFDMSAIRIMIVVLMVVICSDRDKLYDFIDTIKYNKIFISLLPYIFVLCYTAALRADVKAFLNPFVEFYTLFLTVYIVKETIGVEKSISVMLGCFYFLVFMGVAEYIRGDSIFKVLQTLDGVVAGAFVRGGQYRIMGPASHSIAYGILLNIGVAIAALDMKKNKIYLFQRPILFLLLFINIIFTGSRSALAVFLLTVPGVFLLSAKEEKKKTLLIGITGIILMIIFVLLTSGTPVGKYFMLQFTSIIDEIFGTSLSLNYGATKIIKDSSDYRDALWDVFDVDWLNPLVGIGRKRRFATKINGRVLESLDNFYIAEYVRYAYPGMIAIILFFGYTIYLMFRKMIKNKDDIYTKIFLLCTVLYVVSLYFVDSIGTLKYCYLIIALFVCKANDVAVFDPRHKRSKYLRQAI